MLNPQLHRRKYRVALRAKPPSPQKKLHTLFVPMHHTLHKLDLYGKHKCIVNMCTYFYLQSFQKKILRKINLKRKKAKMR